MKAKTKFLKMYYKLPTAAKNELMVTYWNKPYSLCVVNELVKYDTNLGKELLQALGYKDDD